MKPTVKWRRIAFGWSVRSDVRAGRSLFVMDLAYKRLDEQDILDFFASRCTVHPSSSLDEAVRQQRDKMLFQRESWKQQPKYIQ